MIIVQSITTNIFLSKSSNLTEYGSIYLEIKPLTIGMTNIANNMIRRDIVVLFTIEARLSFKNFLHEI